MQDQTSLLKLLACDPAWASRLDRLTNEEIHWLRWTWEVRARPNQLPPNGDWRVWLILAGRGGGKTRTGAETSRSWAKKFAGSRGALVGRTAADVRDVMVEGESGILACCPPEERPLYEPSKRRLTWPNGTIATCYSAEEPELLRGPQHHWAWCDELAAWQYPDAWDQLMFGLRLGDDPRVVVTTTPKPKRLIRELVRDRLTHVTRYSTRENAENLADAFLQQLMKKYEGTTLGRQELEAELLEEMPGALWKRTMFEREGFRVERAPDLLRIVVPIDPAVSAKEGSNETGIVPVGVSEAGHYFVLCDLSMRSKPDGWARASIDAYKNLRADRIVAEVNQGGDLVESVIRTIDADVAYQSVHASRGKRTRAEPVAALYEQGRVHHVGAFPDLEDQCCTWEPGIDSESPDRLDSLVWGITALMETAPIEVLIDADTGYREREEY